MNAVVMTSRLRLEPIRAELACDLWLVHQDDAVAFWTERWSRGEADQRARAWGNVWASGGVHKWLAYDRNSAEVVGRGGLSRVPVRSASQTAIREVLGDAQWDGLELGWALRSAFWGRGLATEIGRAGLYLAFEALEAPSVIAFTERHNLRSRAVMERLGMRFAGEILHRGLIEGLDGVHENAPFAVYLLGRVDFSGAKA